MRGRPLPLALTVLAVLLMAGCGRHGAHRPATGLAAPNVKLNAGGETPSWSAVVRPGELVLSVGDAAPLKVAPTAASKGKDAASWTGALPAKGGSVSLDVAPGPCQDAETGMTYPLKATAGVQGRRYAGCAAPPGQGLGPRA